MPPGLYDLIADWLNDHKFDFKGNVEPDGNYVFTPIDRDIYADTTRIILMPNGEVIAHFDTDTCHIEELDSHSPDFFTKLNEFLKCSSKSNT